MAYRPVKFNPGNPLDVNELNQLDSNITEAVNSATATLQNTLNEQGQLIKKVAIVSCGSAEVIGMTENTFGKVEVPISSTNFSQNPTVTVTIAEKMGSEDIDIYVEPISATRFNIHARSNSKTRKTLKVNWIAAQLKTQS